MLLDFYQLKEQPFGVTPDPRFLYLGESHREALASLCYGVKMGRGLVALVAPPGMGKTTLLFRLLEHLRQSARTAFLFQTQCDPNGLLHYLLGDLGINTRGQDFVGMHDQLNSLLVEEARAGRRFVVIIDEAQNLGENVLETARLLTDFETSSEKLLQIILAGQPQLADKLKRPELIQLRQRISTVGRLRPLGLSEVNDYINHRLQVAGCGAVSVFTPAAVAKIASISEGIPRNINNLCFNSLSLGYAVGAKAIDAGLVSEAATDVDLSFPTTAELLPEQPRTVSAREVAVTAGAKREADGENAAAASDWPSRDRAAQELRRSDGSREMSAPRTGAREIPAREDADARILVLESLEAAAARNAEILAEVVEASWKQDEAERAEPQLILNETQEGELATARSQIVGAVCFSGTDQEGADTPRVDSLQASAAPRNSPEFLPRLTISYSAKRRPIVRRFAAVAALSVLSLAGFLYRLDVIAAASDLRQIVVASSVAQRLREAVMPAPDGMPSPAEIRFAERSPAAVVQPHENLTVVCLRVLGKYDARLAKEVLQLNPDLTDPDHLVVGQRIVLPTSTATGEPLSQ